MRTILILAMGLLIGISAIVKHQNRKKLELVKLKLSKIGLFTEVIVLISQLKNPKKLMEEAREIEDRSVDRDGEAECAIKELKLLKLRVQQEIYEQSKAAKKVAKQR